MKPSEPLERIVAAATALLFLVAAGAHAQHWCATTLEIPDGRPPLVQYQLVEAPSASETVVIGVLFVYTDDLTALQVRRRSVEWLKVANQLFNEGTARHRIVLKRAGVRLAPEEISRISRTATPSDRFPELFASLRANTRSMHTARNELGGDVVTLVVPFLPDDVWGGIANIPTRQTLQLEPPHPRAPFGWAGSMQNVMSMSTGTGRIHREGEILAHEIGHNLGLHHDRETIRQNDRQDPDEVARWLYDPLGLGYATDSFSNGAPARGGVGTVMAYTEHNLRGFSRPTGLLGVIGRGLKARRGDETTNADRALRVTAATVAAIYAAEPDDPDPPPAPKPEPEPEPDPAPDPSPGPPSTSDCVEGYCHHTGFGPRFAVQYFHEGEWRFAEVAVQSGDSAVFHFFGADNLEVFAKVLNGCRIDGTVWVYASGLTDLPVALHLWRGDGESTPFMVPDGTVLRPQNGGRLNWC